MIPTPDVHASVPLQAVEACPTCPTAAPSAPVPPLAPAPTAAAGLLAAWARRSCPNLRDGRCVAEHARGRQACSLLLDPPKRCPWAERGPALGAPEPIFRAYQSLIGPHWPRCLVRRPEPTSRAATAPVAPAVEVAPVEAGPVEVPPVPVAAPAEVEALPLAVEPSRAADSAGRRCRQCGAPVGPRRLLCDPCRTLARRKTWRESSRTYRRRVFAT